MAFAASLLRSEMRRHLLMNFGLVASCVAAGTVVTNERGLFVPIEFRMGDTARAFAAMFTQSHLLPDNTELSNVRMVSPLDAFEVTADSRDLRRRLMESFNETGAGDNNFGEDPSNPFNQAMNSSTKYEPEALTAVTAPDGSSIASTAIDGTGSPAGSGAANNVASASNGETSTPGVSSTSPTSVPSAASTSTANNPVNNQAPVNTSAVAAQTPTTTDPIGAVPEPSTWAMLITGFGFIGYLLRASRRRRQTAGANADV